MDSLVRTATVRGVTTLTLDSPTNRNALSTALIDQLLGGFRAVSRERGAAFLIGLFCCQSLVRGALNVTFCDAHLEAVKIHTLFIDMSAQALRRPRVRPPAAAPQEYQTVGACPASAS